MRGKRGNLLFVLAFGAAAWAAVAGAWQSKDFKDWTEKDARAVMTSSPWGKQVPLPAAARPAVMVMEPGSNGAPPPTASLGNPSNTTTGTNMTVAGNAGSAGGADPSGLHNLPTTQTPSQMEGSAGAPTPHPALTIIWASATPIRLAVLKLRTQGGPITETQVENAMKPRPNYVIAVSGLPAPEGEFDPKELAKSASLRVRGKPPLAANDCAYRRIGNSDVYFFHFTRTALPITAADQEVEFKMRMGQAEIKKRFDLKEMQYQGQLAL
jgi:hypothetical protein